MSNNQPLARATSGRNRPQLRDIAAAAQVSISTVSRVLNNVEGINETLRERVLLAATSLGYQFKGERLKHIHLFISTSLATRHSSAFHTDVMAGVEEECRRQKILLSYAVIDSGMDPYDFVLETVKQHSTDGLLFMAQDDRGLIEQAAALNYRTALINTDLPRMPVDTFLPDNDGGAREAVRYLIEHGHRSILHLTNLGRNTLKRRHVAYQAVLAEAGIPYDPTLVQETILGPESAYETMKTLLARETPRFTAIFCGNDNSALGVMRALQEAGLRVPQDISIVSFDDMPMAAFTSPPLTTVRIEREEMGRLAVRRLLARVENPTLTPIRVELYTRLIERESVAAPQACP